MGSMDRPLSHQPSLLSEALDRFHYELKSDDEAILDVDNVEELLAQAKAMEPASSGRSKPSSFKRLESILPHINDFAAIIAVCSGADAKAAGLVWGSLKVVFMLASSSSDTLNDILNMLDELSLSLPRFRSYEETLPMDEALESALIEVYTEMTCFCARTINFFRNNPHRPLIKMSWPKLNNDFNQTIKRLKQLSRIVDTKAEEVRLREDRERNTELLSAMELMKNTNIADNVLPCYLIPFGVDEQFHGRLDVLERLQKGLIHEKGVLKVNVLWGMGGIGKTKTALQYVNKFRQDFDAIFWISADNSIKLTQDFLEVSKKLHLSPDVEDGQDAVAAMSKVKTWLSTTNCRWLLVFDNADDPDVLLNAWPGAATGSILITSRDSTAAFGTSAEIIHVLPFDEDTSVEAIIRLVGRDPSSSFDRNAAREISRALGGLPLAINQISGFIVQQKLAMKDFLPLYQKNAARIDARKLKRGDYGHTISTVWELSLARLSGISSTLQNLLAFFDPDKIHESILLEGGEHIEDEKFGFLRDDMDFLDAKEPLLKAALIDRSSETESLTTHRLVQAAVMRRLTKDEKIEYFDVAITILSNGFPNTWNTVTSHQFTAWAKCELCLPHVNFLIEESKRNSLKASDPKKFSELILRCCWYLYEREHYTEARQFMKTALENLEEKDSLMYASAAMLDGLIELDTSNVSKALDSFLLAFEIRQQLIDPDDAFIASSLNALSIAYTELGDLDKAVETGQRAIDIRLRTKSDRIGNSYSNMASTLMRMGKADEAEEMLKRCPSLKEFTDETFLQTGNPRFSGDMVLLARIRLQQGRLDDAIRLSSKALAFRQKLLGSRFKVCDSLYQVASLLEIRRDLSSSINLLEESVSIAENIPEAKGYEARAQFRLSRLYKGLGNIDKFHQHEIGAKKAWSEISHDAITADVTEKDFDSLVLWMLW